MRYRKRSLRGGLRPARAIRHFAETGFVSDVLLHAAWKNRPLYQPERSVRGRVHRDDGRRIYGKRQSVLL